MSLSNYSKRSDTIGFSLQNEHGVRLKIYEIRDIQFKIKNKKKRTLQQYYKNHLKIDL